MNFSIAGIKKDPLLSSYLWSFSKPAAGPPFNLIFKEPCSSASQQQSPRPRGDWGWGQVQMLADVTCHGMRQE